MLEAYEYSAWDHTASLLCCVAGLVKQGVKVEQFHPYRRADAQRGRRATGSALQGLKARLGKWKDPNE